MTLCPGVNYGKLLRSFSVDEELIEAIKELHNDDTV
jgi:hypothetical protein